MKIKVILWIAAIALIISLTAIRVAASKDAKPEVITPQPIVDILTAPQRVWMNALRWCESNGVDGSINPKDRDNTPSWGRYQFKPGTFKYYQGLYELTGELMDGEAQERIVEQMIVVGKINWAHEFPACVRKLGSPPRAKLSTTKTIDNK